MKYLKNNKGKEEDKLQEAWFMARQGGKGKGKILISRKMLEEWLKGEKA